MCFPKLFGWSTLSFFVLATQTAYSSQESIGPNGINSSALGLTGAGIAIGQVEVNRPAIAGETGANTNIIPAGVFVQDMMAGTNANVGLHAQQVAGVMISSDTTDSDVPPDGRIPTGVAPDAALYSSATNVPSLPGQPEAALSAQHVALQASGNVRAINMSFGEKLVGSTILDGNSLLTQFVDWSAAEHDVLYVVAGNQGNMIPVPKDNFNGMTIARSTKNGGVYRQVSSGNTYNEDAVGPRTSIDLLAPGDGIQLAGFGSSEADDTGTSFAAPHVTGTVALLQEYGDERIMNSGTPTQWNPNGNARRHEVMKAVLMNSADKLEDTGDGNRLGMTRTVLDSNGNDWLHASNTAATSSFVSLHEEFGAGHLNADRALKQFRSGEHEANGADVPVIGWDYGFSSGTNDEDRYAIGDELRAGSYLSITLAWDRIVEFDNDAGTLGKYDIGDTFETYTDLEDVLNDLDILLVQRGDDISADPIIASSDGQLGFGDGFNLEHLFFEIPTTGQYDIVIDHVNNGEPVPLGSQEYGIAWWGATDALLGSGDFNGDGRVDFGDYSQWAGDYGINAHSDADGDGDTDGFDFLRWQFGLGTGATPLAAASSAVPEPATGLLLMMGLIFATQAGPRRRQAIR